MSVQQEQARADRSLWRAVILQALGDAVMPADPTTLRGKRILLDVEQSRSWLTSNSRDFRRVCNLAELEPDRVRALAVQAIERGSLATVTTAPKPREPTARRSKRAFAQFNGESIHLDALAARHNMNVRSLRSRLRAGMSLAEALSRPIAMTRGRPRLSPAS